MTSRTSSKPKSSQTYITRNRVWLISLMTLIGFLVYVVGFLLKVRGIKHSMEISSPTYLVTLQNDLSHNIVTFLGGNRISTVIAVVFAILLGLTSFNYLYKSKTIDFYFSIPEKKMSYFRDVCFNSIMIYTIMSVAFYFISILFSAIFGLEFTKNVVENILQGFVSNYLLFLAYYGICIMAQAVCGNTFISILMAGFFAVIELAIRATVGYMSFTFFSTYSSYANGSIPLMDNYVPVITSPIYNTLAENFGTSCIHNLLIALVTFVLTYFAYKNYKGEFAGKAVVYKGVRYFLKVCTSFLAGIWAAMLILMVVSYDYWNERIPYTILGALLGTVIISSICEIVFALDIHAMFKRIWQAPIVAVACILFCMSFYSDWYGYDSYVPDKEDVVDCAIALHGEADYQYIIREYSGQPTLDSSTAVGYAAEYMHLPYTDDVMTFAKIGMETACQGASDTGYSEEYKDSYIYNAEIIYRLKNDHVVYRSISIPAKMDANVLNAIIGSDEYKYTSFTLDNFDNWRKLTGGFNSLSFASCMDIKMTDEQIDEFEEAYRKDLKHFNYTVATENTIYGNVTYEKRMKVEQSDPGYTGDEYEILFSQGFPVYESFENTIAFLQKYEMYDTWEIIPPEYDFINYVEIQKDDESTYDAANGYYQQTEGTAYVYDQETVDAISEAVVPAYGNGYNYHWHNPSLYAGYYIYYHIYDEESNRTFALRKDNIPQELENLDYQ